MSLQRSPKVHGTTCRWISCSTTSGHAGWKGMQISKSSINKIIRFLVKIFGVKNSPAPHHTFSTSPAPSHLPGTAFAISAIDNARDGACDGGGNSSLAHFQLKEDHSKVKSQGSGFAASCTWCRQVKPQPIRTNIVTQAPMKTLGNRKKQRDFRFCSSLPRRRNW